MNPLNRNPITNSALDEDLKQMGGRQRVTYFDAWLCGKPPIRQAITIATEREKDSMIETPKWT